MTRLQTKISKYGPDLLLFYSDRAIEDIIWSTPAFTDKEWALFLKTASPATRQLIFKNLPQIRVRSIKQLLAETDIPHEHGHDLLKFITTTYGSGNLIFPRNSQDDFDLSQIRIDNGSSHRFTWAEEPYSLFTVDIEENIRHWAMVINACREFGISLLERHLEPDIDDYTKKLVLKALQSCGRNRFNARDLSGLFLKDLNQTLECMSLIILGICSGTGLESLRQSLADKLGLDPSEIQERTGDPLHIQDKMADRKTASAMLALTARTKHEGILSIESFLSSIPSVFFSEGLSLVVDGLEPDFVSQWLDVRKDLVLQKAASNFKIAETACLSILNKQNLRIAQIAIQAHSLTKSTFLRQTGRLTPEPEEGQFEKEAEAPLSDSSSLCLTSTYDWFRFKVCLDFELDRNEFLFSRKEQLSELAAIIPPDRWPAVETSAGISADERQETYVRALEELLNNPTPSIATDLLNLTKNLKPDLNLLPGNLSHLSEMLLELRNLEYWDLLMLSRENFKKVFSSITREAQTALCHTSLGVYASYLDLPLDCRAANISDAQDARRALILALARNILNRYGFKTAVPNSSTTPSICTSALPKFITAHIEVFFTDNASEFDTIGDDHHLLNDFRDFLDKTIKELTRVPSCERVTIFDNLPEHITSNIFQSLQEGTKELEMVCSLLPQLDRIKREKFMQQINIHKNNSAISEALSFGFDELINLPDTKIRELLKHITSQNLCLGLVDSPPELKNRFLENLSERAAVMIGEDIQIYSENSSREQQIKARQELVNAVLELGLMTDDSSDDIVCRIISMAEKGS